MKKLHEDASLTTSVFTFCVGKPLINPSPPPPSSLSPGQHFSRLGPYCDVAALVDKKNKVFACQNSECEMETCKTCKSDWDDDHFGRKCAEVESRDEAGLRRRIEEDMTSARIRDCPGCGAPMVKSDGCNKMECRCGTKVNGWPSLMRGQSLRKIARVIRAFD